jgi:hypothetical protein
MDLLLTMIEAILALSPAPEDSFIGTDESNPNQILLPWVFSSSNVLDPKVISSFADIFLSGVAF